MRKPDPLPPLYDDEGKNVFSEGEKPGEAAPADAIHAEAGREAQRENVYAAGTARAFDAATAERPQYETMLASRGALMFWLLLVCCFVFGVSAAFWYYMLSYELFARTLPPWTLILPLGVSLPMTFVAWFDLRAMRHGAMDTDARFITRATFALGTVVSLIGLSILGYYAWTIFYWMTSP